MQTVLVIDDEESVLKTVVLGLKKNRFRVLASSTAVKGLSMAREQQIHLILCDLHLGGPQETRATATLRELATANRIPFIAMTGRPEPGHTDLLLAKPFTLTELVGIVRKNIHGVKNGSATSALTPAQSSQPLSPLPQRSSFKTSREQLEHLLRRVERLREEERTQVARAIHDDLTQTLTVLALEISFLESALASAPGQVKPAEYIPPVRKLGGLVNSLIRSAQEITARLRPKVLDEFGFVAALEWLAGQVQRDTGTPCELVVNGSEVHLEPALAGGLYRLSQEILGHAARHSPQSGMRIVVAHHHGTLKVEFSVFAASESSADRETSLEILALREQAERLGGTLDLTPAGLRVQLPANQHQSRL